MHPDQLTVSVETVYALVANQFPDWAGLPITEIASQGTVNALFRLGDQLATRFPLQPADASETRRWLESEAEAAQALDFADWAVENAQLAMLDAVHARDYADNLAKAAANS